MLCAKNTENSKKSEKADSKMRLKRILAYKIHKYAHIQRIFVKKMHKKSLMHGVKKNSNFYENFFKKLLQFTEIYGTMHLAC